MKAKLPRKTDLVPMTVLAHAVPFSLWISLLMMTGCVPRSEKAVVLYCAADREYASPILDAYERSVPGTEVVRQFDVEASKTLGLVTRIQQESIAPKCDVFWNNEILHTIRLQQQGLLESRRWLLPDDWPKNYRASDGTWVGFAARARVLLVNTERLKDREEWPQRVAELADERWRKRCGMAYPIYGTTATHMAILATHENALGTDARWDAWITKVASNGVILAGNKQVALSVSSGELDWGLTDTDDAMIELESGKPVRIVFPDQGESDFGSLFIPNTLAVIHGARHPIAAASLADHLVSEKVESRLTMSSSAHFPVWPTASQASRIPSDNIRWSNIDFEAAARQWDQVREKLLNVFP
jgi:iron(III) transport system substrate-binding protein